MIGIRGRVYWIEDAGPLGVILYCAAAWHQDGDYIGTFPTAEAAIESLRPAREAAMHRLTWPAEPVRDWRAGR